jgi:hypothetical protein
MHRSIAVGVYLIIMMAGGCQTASRPAVSRAPAPQPIAAAGATPRLEIAGQPAPPVRPPSAAQPPAAEPATRPALPTAQPKPAKPVAIEGQTPIQPPTDNLAKMMELYRSAATKYANIDNYICRFRRREVVDGKQMPEDRILFKFRKEPFSVYFKWLEGTACEGREIIYVRGMYDNKLQVKTGRRDSLLPMQVSLDLHSERVTANSRHTMDEAGMGKLIDGLGQALAAQEAGDTKLGVFQYLGPQQRPESAVPMECMLQQVPGGLERHLIRGGQRYWFFCSDTRLQECGLPVLVITYDENRREVEYYYNDRFNLNVVPPQDFDPRIVWAKR